jgi:streptogramin lyase
MHGKRILLFALSALSLISSCKGSGGSGEDSTLTPSPTPGGTNSAAPETFSSNTPSADRKGVWIINAGESIGGIDVGVNGFVVRLDPTTGKSGAKFNVTAPNSLVECGGDVWVGSKTSDGIFRLDAVQNSLKATISHKPDGGSVATVSSLACTGSDVWALGLDKGYEFINIGVGSNAVNKVVPQLVPPPTSIMAASGSLYAALMNSSIQKMDGSSGEVLKTFSLGSIMDGEYYIPLGMIPVGETLWIAAADGNDIPYLIAVNTTSGERKSKISLSGSTPGTQIALGQRLVLAAEGSAVWIAIQKLNEVWRIDTVAAAVTDKIAVGKEPEGIAVGLGAVWVTNKADSTVTKIDIASKKVATTYETGGKSPSRVIVTE